MMTFNHKHYVPILKGKRAEFLALGSLMSKDGITPVIEVVPSVGAGQTPQRMAAAQWPSNQPYFIDVLFLDDPDDTATPAPPTHPVRLCFTEVAAQGQIAIPVTGFSRSPGYQSAIQQVVAAQGNGFVLRLTPDDFEDVEALEVGLDVIPNYFNVDRTQVDLLLDIGSVANSSAGTVAQMHRANIDLIPNLDEWRTLTVASSAFPLGLAPLERNQWNPASRLDWRGWRALITATKRPKRLPAYSDYAIAHPALPPEGIATILAQLRYASIDSWIIWKGRNAITEGFDQFFAICADLVSRPEYRGANFSWGDAEIAQKAANVGSCGNAQTWRQIGTSHHLETVLDQISNLP
jgi:hypothetical protein